MGRPSIYTPEVADAICERLIGGESLRRICDDEAMPSRATVLRWLATDHEGFEAKYTQARAAQILGEADDLLEIADNSRNDWMERHGEDDAGWLANGENIQRAKLRVATRQWIASKLLPKKYGDRTVIAGDPDAPLKHDHSVALSAETASLLASLKAGPSGAGDAAPVPD